MKIPVVHPSVLAEDAGHMGWSSHDYPGCPERVRKVEEAMRREIEQIEMKFDEANEPVA